MKNFVLFSIFFAVVALANFSYASKIVKVGPQTRYVITTDEFPPWALHENICLTNSNIILVCGIIQQKTSSHIGIKVTQKMHPLKEGDYVLIRKNSRRVASVVGNEKVASSEEIKKINSSNSDDMFDGTVGLVAGFNYFFPSLHLQMALSKEFSIGLLGAFVTGGGSNSVTGAGGFLTFDYFITHYAFRGLYLQGGIGLYNLTAQNLTASQTTTPPSIEVSIEWRGKAYWGLPFDIGVGIGGQYLIPGTRTIAYSFQYLMPWFTAFLGYSF